MLETTVRLDDKLMKDAERLAAATGRSLDALLEDALRDLLASKRIQNEEATGSLPTFDSGGYPPGVDLSDNRGVRDYLDGHDVAHAP